MTNNQERWVYGSGDFLLGAFPLNRLNADGCLNISNPHRERIEPHDRTNLTEMMKFGNLHPIFAIDRWANISTDNYELTHPAMQLA